MAFEPFYNEEAKSSDALDNHLKGKDPFGMNSAVVNQWEEWLSKDKLEKNLDVVEVAGAEEEMNPIYKTANQSQSISGDGSLCSIEADAVNGLMRLQNGALLGKDEEALEAFRGMMMLAIQNYDVCANKPQHAHGTVSVA